MCQIEIPLRKPIQFENPSRNSPQFDPNPNGSLHPQFPQTLEISTQEGEKSLVDEIKDTHVLETVEKSSIGEESSQDEIENDLGSAKNEVNDCENPSGHLSGRKRSHKDTIFGPLSQYSHKHFWDRRNGDDFDDVLEWEEPKPCPVGAGLANMGNTCFLNAIVQCFTHTVPLVQGLLSLKHDSISHGNYDYCVLCAVRDQVEHSLAYSGRAISPSNLVDNLSQISSFFGRYQQEDAHEFLQCLLDKLDSNWLKYERSANNLSPSDGSLVNQVFGGRLVSQLHCSKCGHNSYTYEPLIDLSLGIEDVDNLDSALGSFTKVENIGDTEKFTCENCKEQVTGEKQLMLDQVPSVAALHLKRFKSDGIYVEKIDKKVEYPLELNLKPYIKGANDNNEELKYELFAVVVHVGRSSTSGHYFCYIRTAPDAWYRFDDSKVSRVSEVTVLSQDAYILFYARKGTAWFSSLFEEWKLKSEEKILNTSPKSVLDDSDLPSTSRSFGAGFHGDETVEKSVAAGCAFVEPSVGLRCDEVQAISGVDTQASEPINKTPTSTGQCLDEVKVDGADFDDLYSVRTNDNCSIQLSTETRNTEDAMGANGKGETERISHEACSSSRVENMIDSEVKHDTTDISPSTPPRSPSPGIYSDEEPADAAYRIPVHHLKTEDNASSAKKSMDKALHDLKRKEAAKYMSKSMPVGRRQVLLAAMMGGGSRSESPLNKKRKQVSSLQGRLPKRVAA